MKKGVFSKLVATFALIISISFIITAAVLSYWFETYYFEQRKNQLQAESRLIIPITVQYLNGNKTSEKVSETLSYIGSYLSTNIWLVDSYGFVYAVSDSSHRNLMATQVLTKDLEMLSKGEMVEKKGGFKEVFTGSVHTFEIPIIYNGVFTGVIMMHTSINELREPLKKVYEIIWGSAILAIIISWVVIYYFSQRIIVRPLEKINYVADKIAKGEVDKRVDICSKDEIGELSKSFNSMADSLEEIEKNRREFISNVSHEIRSPITSIKGFIGAIIDGVIPKEKEKYYLSIAYEETQRLTRLVNDLLDLSSIDSGQFTLRIEEVDVNETIRLSIINFHEKIREKKLKADIFLEGEKLMVAADKDRLIQVITNLLDNAIKYSPKSGNISVATTVKTGKVYVSIYNDGPLISEKDLKNIWDRFYKVDKSRTTKHSTGLGLPIVRSILTQLGEDIWAQNKGKTGVVFNFTLKKV